MDSTAAVQACLKQLVESGHMEEGNRCMVEMATLARCLDVPPLHAKIMVDTLEAVSEEHQLLVQRTPGKTEAEAVEAHAVALFLFAQLYIRQAQRPDAMDVWPSPTSVGETSPSQPEPLSPIRSPARAANNHSVHFQHSKSNHMVRKELQAHLHQHQGLLQGYTDYLQRHTHSLLPLLLNKPPAQAGSNSGSITAGEFDRLGLLLRPATEPSHSGEDGSPMDVTPTPFGDQWRLSLHVPMFSNTSERGEAPISAVAEWLASNVVDESQPADMPSSPTHGGDRWRDLPPAGVSQSNEMDIQGVCKSTVIRGEDDFPSGVVRITDCHDTIVYALAPLQYASVCCCSDCTVVLGAVGRMLRVERCERLQLIASCVRICISACHDCVLYLGVNHPPLLLGDNRFLQMAPYNTQYERLPVHMAAAGVQAEPNRWDSPATLARDPNWRATPDSQGSPNGSQEGGGAVGSRQWSLLPPERLLPFMVPFQGGRGPMCGGAAATTSSRLSTDLGSLVGLADGNSLVNVAQPPSPFRLPPAYEEAKEKKVNAVHELRNAVKLAGMDDGRKRELQNTIQAYFKEWLLSTGNMRQIHDMARMEREQGSQ
ncbi:hypothetical protein WJX72_007884 [[Myrmecia] bisecta]|uniref:C-CAP/cofactor C-like domain-containing protein n=1 Tax=[Myrmecia] bisecta TaxID=41462 RepID=A0AAW1QRJ1_9CHLO